MLRRRAAAAEANTFIPQILCTIQKLSSIHNLFWFQFIVKLSAVGHDPRPDVFGKEIEREIFIPGRFDILLDLLCLEPFLDDREVVLAVIDEIVINRLTAPWTGT